MRPLLVLAALALAGACKLPPPEGQAPERNGRVPPRALPPPPPPTVVRDTVLEQRVDRLELRLLEREAQVEELQARLNDARREVVRAMAKLQSLATRAEAASGMAEAEIALETIRTANGGGTGGGGHSVFNQASELLQLATTEFDRQNYAGALYLATQAKNAARAGQGRLGSGDRGTLRAGEVAFALPLRVATTGRANLRAGPGGTHRILYTLDAGAPLVAYSYVEQWVRVTDEGDRPGWIHQGLIGRRR